MAHVGTSDPSSTSATLTPSSYQSQTGIRPKTDATPNSTETRTVQQTPTELPSIGAPVESDDEVQFVFSAPRRRKKKRRRIESSHISAEDFQGPKAPTNDPPPSAAATEPPRRGTTGMVQQLEFCHIREAKPVPGTRSGSLPLIPVTSNVNPNPRSAAFNLSNQGNPSSQFLPFAPFMSMPWWADQNLQLPDTPMAQHDWNPIQPEEKASNKRKREGEPEQPRFSPKQRSQAEQSSLQVGYVSQLGGTTFEPLDGFANSSTNFATVTLPNVPSPTSKMQNFSWNSNSTMNQTQERSPTPASAGTKTSITNSLRPNFRTSQKASVQCRGKTRPFQNNAQKQTVTVPARLVPEQSVSPRTQTVEIPRLPYTHQVQPRQMMLLQRAMNANSQLVPSLENPGAMLPMNRNNQFQIPRSVHPQALFPVDPPENPQNPSPNGLQALQTYPSDILRKPSLYKIPPWPSPPSPASLNQIQSSAARPSTPTASVVNSMLGMSNTANSEVGGSSGHKRGNMIHSQSASVQGLQDGFPAQRMMPVTPPRAPPLQSQPRPSPPSSSLPPQLQENPIKRKHSPNLIVDIAETCQSNFPFAAVAERHQTPIQKVFDTFSAIIQLPLLRSASDNRRHGSLGKHRMKEFRDAKKAMEKEMKNKAGDVGHGPGRGRKNAKKGPEQPLLRAAILNNASRRKDGASS